MPDDTVWEAIRRDYDDYTLSISDICSKHRIDKYRLAKLRIANNWTKRPDAIGMKRELALRRAARAMADIAAGPAPSLPVPPPLPAPDDGSASASGTAADAPATAAAPRPPRRQAPIAQRRALVARIMAAIDTKLVGLERRFADEIAAKPKANAAADTERDMRAIGQLIKNLEQVTAYADGTETGSRIHGAAARSAALAACRLADEADKFRHDLGQRLSRLADAAKAGAAESAGEPRA